jgi:hypothetical protein
MVALEENMATKMQTNFRLFESSIADLDRLVSNPPPWLTACAPGPVKDRTEVVERLIFLATNGESPSAGAALYESVKTSPKTANRRTSKRR